MAWHIIFRNMFTCEGFANKGFMGGCSQSWLVLTLLVLIGAVIRRQCDDGILQGVPFSTIGAGVSLIVPFLLIAFFGDMRIALVGGIIALAAGGFGGAAVFGDGSG